MNYKKIYDNLITSRFIVKNDRISLKKLGNYYEAHHIIPKCKGGKNSIDNIVLLTAREHFLAHWLLWLIYRDRQTALGFHKMLSSNNKQKRITSAKGYEEAREAYRITNIGNTYGKGSKGNVGKKHSKEQNENHAKTMKGENNPFFNKHHTKESKKIISDLAKLRKGESNSNYRGTKLVMKNGLIVGEFKTSAEVAEFIGCSITNIRNTLSGNQKTAKGFEITYNTNGLDDRKAKLAKLKTIIK